LGPDRIGDADHVNLYFGPESGKAGEGRWIKTTPSRGWFAYFRIYGPKAPALDGSWRLPDFEATG
jgi:hypothetical protein